MAVLRHPRCAPGHGVPSVPMGPGRGTLLEVVMILSHGKTLALIHLCHTYNLPLWCQDKTSAQKMEAMAEKAGKPIKITYAKKPRGVS